MQPFEPVYDQLSMYTNDYPNNLVGNITENGIIEITSAGPAVTKDDWDTVINYPTYRLNIDVRCYCIVKLFKLFLLSVFVEYADEHLLRLHEWEVRTYLLHSSYRSIRSYQQHCHQKARNFYRLVAYNLQCVINAYCFNSCLDVWNKESSKDLQFPTILDSHCQLEPLPWWGSEYAVFYQHNCCVNVNLSVKHHLFLCTFV